MAILTGKDSGWLVSGTDSPAHDKLARIRKVLDEQEGVPSGTNEQPGEENTVSDEIPGTVFEDMLEAPQDPDPETTDTEDEENVGEG